METKRLSEYGISMLREGSRRKKRDSKGALFFLVVEEWPALAVTKDPFSRFSAVSWQAVGVSSTSYVGLLLAWTPLSTW